MTRYLSDEQLEQQHLALRVQVEELERRLVILEDTTQVLGRDASPVSGCQNHGREWLLSCAACRAAVKLELRQERRQGAQPRCTSGRMLMSQDMSTSVRIRCELEAGHAGECRVTWRP